MATNKVVLALLRNGPAHGYDLKRDHDARSGTTVADLLRADAGDPGWQLRDAEPVVVRGSRPASY